MFPRLRELGGLAAAAATASGLSMSYWVVATAADQFAAGGFSESAVSFLLGIFFAVAIGFVGYGILIVPAMLFAQRFRPGYVTFALAGAAAGTAHLLLAALFAVGRIRTPGINLELILGTWNTSSAVAELLQSREHLVTDVLLLLSPVLAGALGGAAYFRIANHPEQKN